MSISNNFWRIERTQMMASPSEASYLLQSSRRTVYSTARRMGTPPTAKATAFSPYAVIRSVTRIGVSVTSNWLAD